MGADLGLRGHHGGVSRTGKCAVGGFVGLLAVVGAAQVVTDLIWGIERYRRVHKGLA